MRSAWTTTGVWSTKKNWLPFVCWWLVSKTHWATTKEEIFLENCMAAVTMQWQNQLFQGPTQKSRKLLTLRANYAAKNASFDFMLHVHFLLGSGLDRLPVMSHFHTQFPGLFQCSPIGQCVHSTEPEHNRLWASCGIDKALTDLMPSRSAHSSLHKAHRRPGRDNRAIT